MAKETYYFSHDYNARNDEKILELRSVYGAEGYGIFWMIIETMAETSSCAIDTKLIGGLSISFGYPKEKLVQLIKFCVSVSLLSKNGNLITSKRLAKHREHREERSLSGKNGAQKKWQTVRERKEQFAEMVSFFNNTCVRCEGASGLINVERDHIIPSYQGGVDHISNLQPLCARCNASKGPEHIDHRVIYAKKHGLVIPELWLSYNIATAKERKVKESKGNEIKGNKIKLFIEPTENEAFEYFYERQKNKWNEGYVRIQSEKFIARNQSNGWMVGKNKMKDWKAAVRTWILNDYDKYELFIPSHEIKKSTQSIPTHENTF